jgi:hypothetical protein
MVQTLAGKVLFGVRWFPATMFAFQRLKEMRRPPTIARRTAGALRADRHFKKA